MNLASIKSSHIPKRKLFEIERAIVREIVDLWCKEKSYFNHNFAGDVNIEFKGKRIEVSFSNTARMQYGQPEATVNEVMRGLILTMATDTSGRLLKNQEAIIGNILDVFVHRLREIADRKFILQRLQSLELAFSVAFGLEKEFYPIKKARHFLQEVITIASLSTAQETADALIHDMHETASVAPREHGVTFHIVIEKQDEASFISLPFRSEQTSYVSLLGTHALRCNIIAELDHRQYISTGILKIDAPSNPVKFMQHKGFAFELDKKALMVKLGSREPLQKNNFSSDELSFLKLLFNEYVQLAHFLVSSSRINPGLRLLLIFPRVNIFKILHEEKATIPLEEPQTLGDLAVLHDRLFTPPSSPEKKEKRSHRIPEKIIQEQVSNAIIALARSILQNVYKPVTAIRRTILSFEKSGYTRQDNLIHIKQSMDETSAYLKKLNQLQGFVLDEKTKRLDIAASIAWQPQQGHEKALDEIVYNIQAAEIEQVREIIVSKMLDYLSFVTVRIEQLERVSSVYIKQEVAREIAFHTNAILDQARSFYKLVLGKKDRIRH